MMLRYLLEKEFKQIKRNSFMPKFILAYPCLVMLVFPWVTNLEVKDINLSIIDNDHSSYSERLIDKIASSKYFQITDVSPAYPKALESVERDVSDAILEINSNFEDNLIKGKQAKVMISSNSVNGAKGGLLVGYLSQIMSDYSASINKTNSHPVFIKVIPQYRFNTHLDYKTFIIPALMAILLTVICGFLPAFNIVGEKEKGTIEQINVSPVKKFTFILSKLIPYWIIGFVILTICFVLAALVYGLIPMGNLFLIYFFAMLFILIFSGFGLVISNYSTTMQQAMFVMFFFVMVMLLMSGIFTPINSMPQWAQDITMLNPLRHFVQVLRAVYLKGSGISALNTQLFVLLGFVLFFNIWAVLSYKKKI